MAGTANAAFERRAGFTLLEILVSLALTALILVALGMTIDFHWRVLDVGRTHVEEAQLARVLLRRIADDLHGAIYDSQSSTQSTTSGSTSSGSTVFVTSIPQGMPPPGSVSGRITLTNAGLASTASVSTAAAKTGGTTTGGRTTGGTTGGKTTGGKSTGGKTTGSKSSGGTTSGSKSSGSKSSGSSKSGRKSSSTSDGDDSGSGTSGGSKSDNKSSENSQSQAIGTPRAAAGLYGDAYSLQVDVSRLPDPRQLQALTSLSPENSSAALRGDIKTVFYFVAGTQTAAIGDNPLGQTDQTGLMRGEMDRATATYATDHGGITAEMINGELLAPEVTSMQFKYYDGTEWVDSWDSSEMGGLPPVVQVTLHITVKKPERSRSSGLAGNSGSGLPEEQTTLPYTLLVHLQAAQSSQSSSGSSTSESSQSNNSTTSKNTTNSNTSNSGTSNSSTSKSNTSKSGTSKSSSQK